MASLSSSLASGIMLALHFMHIGISLKSKVLSKLLKRALGIPLSCAPSSILVIRRKDLMKFLRVIILVGHSLSG